jgi:hypothetical protein
MARRILPATLPAILLSFLLPAASPAVEAGDPVLGLDVAGTSLAYPTAVFEGPAVVSDSSARMPVIVFYDPRTDFAAAYFSMMAGEPLEFSGRASDEAVADDLTTSSRWDMRTGQAVGGTLAGMKLIPIPVRRDTFSGWLQRHPRGRLWEPTTGSETPQP